MSRRIGQWWWWLWWWWCTGWRGRVATQPDTRQQCNTGDYRERGKSRKANGFMHKIFQLSRIVAGQNYGLLVVDGEDVGKTGRGEGRGKKWTDQLKIGEAASHCTRELHSPTTISDSGQLQSTQYTHCRYPLAAETITSRQRTNFSGPGHPRTSTVKYKKVQVQATATKVCYLEMLSAGYEI